MPFTDYTIPRFFKKRNSFCGKSEKFLHFAAPPSHAVPDDKRFIQQA